MGTQDKFNIYTKVMKTKYISDLDFGIENPTPIIFVCDTLAEEITKVFIENLNDDYFDYVKKISRN